MIIDGTEVKKIIIQHNKSKLRWPCPNCRGFGNLIKIIPTQPFEGVAINKCVCCDVCLGAGEVYVSPISG